MEMNGNVGTERLIPAILEQEFFPRREGVLKLKRYV